MVQPERRNRERGEYNMNMATVIALINALAPDPIDPEDVATAVAAYLEEHPEAACPIDDTAGEGDTDKVFSADHVTELVNAVLEAIARQKPPVEYKFSGTDLLLGFGFSSLLDYVVVLNNGRANGLFDFAKLCTKAHGTSLENLATADLTVVWSSGTDMHSPFQFLAVNNADGYHADATSAGFVGGNHTLDQLGTGFETAESIYVNYYADGVPVSSGYGKCASFEIRWANDVQAYNTVKQGGGGRACLSELHDMVFDGVTFKERITLKALEAIKMSLWYGLQCVSIGTTYTSIAFVDASNRGTFSSSDNSITSGNAVTSGFIGFGDDHRIEMDVNTGIDLGKRTYYNGTSGAFVSSTKGYFNFFNQEVSMSAGAQYFLDGSYRFLPQISGSEPEPPSETLTLNKDTLTVEKVGDTDTLVATHTPSSQSDVFTWTSSDTNVATVNSSGVVTVNGIGTATITVTCGNLSATCTVSQTSIKAPYSLKMVNEKIAEGQALTGETFKIGNITSGSGQKAVGQAYHDDGDVRLNNGGSNDIEAIKVPYGATKVKVKTSDDVAVTLSYMLRLDVTDQYYGWERYYPKFIDQITFVNTNTGGTVEYGQAIVFRILDAQAPTLSYVYFE